MAFNIARAMVALFDPDDPASPSVAIFARPVELTLVDANTAELTMGQIVGSA